MKARVQPVEMSEEDPPPPALSPANLAELLVGLTVDQKTRLAALLTKRRTLRDIAERSFFMSKEHPVRAWCIATVERSWFERLVLLIILANTVLLAIYDPLDNEYTGPRNRALIDSALTFNVLFSIEMLIKLIALGLTGPTGYFSDRWHWLDAIVVAAGYVATLPSVGGVAGLRVLRVLRPLRMLHSVPGMRMIVGSMIKALPALGNVATLALLTLLVFSIVGVQLWSGLLRGNCAYTHPDSGVVTFIPNSGAGVWCALSCTAQRGFDCTPSYGDSCAPYPLLRTAADASYTFVTEVESYCAAASSTAALGTNGFDNVGQALVTTYVMITLEGWSTIMYQLQHAWGLKVIVTIYSIALTAFGAFFLLQLALAVIMENYTRSEADELARCEQTIADNTDLLPLRPRRELKAALSLTTLLVQSFGLSPDRSMRYRSHRAPPEPGHSASTTPVDFTAEAGAVVVGDSNRSIDVPAAAASAAPKETPLQHLQRVASHLRVGKPRAVLKVGAPAGLPPIHRPATPAEMPTPADLPGTVRSVVWSGQSSPSEGGASAGVSVGSPSLPDVSSPAGSDVVTVRLPRSPLQKQGYWELDLAGINVYEPPPSVPPPPRWPALHEALMSDRMSYLTMAVMVASFIQLACPHYNMTDEFARNLEYANIAFSVYFALEVVARLVGSGPALYYHEIFHRFYVIVVVLSLIEIALPQNLSDGGLSATRMLRLSRIVRLVRGWDALRFMIGKLGRALGTVTNVLVVMALVVLVFTLVGMQLLGGEYAALVTRGVLPAMPRANYDTFFWGFITTFQIVTLENWNAELANGYAAIGIGGSLFFVVLVLVGSYMFLNLFLAVLLSSFNEGMLELAAAKAAAKMQEDALKQQAQAEAKEARQRAAEQILDAAREQQPSLLSSPLTPGGRLRGGAASVRWRDLKDRLAKEKLVLAADGKVSHFRSIVYSAEGARVHVRFLPSGDVRVIAHEGDESILEYNGPTGTAMTMGDAELEEEAATSRRCVPAPTNRSLGIFRVTSRLRQFCMSLARSSYFEQFTLLLILVASINLALDEPRIATCSLLPSGDASNCIALAAYLKWADIVITALFTLEMVVKIVALGFVRTPNAYLKSGWNALDCLIVVVSIISHTVTDTLGQLKTLRALRALRALRPLRIISRYPSLKLVVNSVFGALPKMKTVLVLNFGVLLVMAIVGLQNFRGALSSCNDSSTPNKIDCIGTFIITGDGCTVMPTSAAEAACRRINGTDWGRRWQPVASNFDNIWYSALTTFELAAGENWPSVMVRSGVDSVGYDLSTQRDANPAAGLFAVLIQLMFSMFLVDIFTGIIISNYQELKGQSQGNGLLTPEQQLWVEQTRLVMSASPSRQTRRPKSTIPWLRRLRNRVYDMAVAPAFELFIRGIILANTATLASKYYGWSAQDKLISEALNDTFAIVFGVEAAIKLTGFGVRQYFASTWSRFDFLLVIASIVGKSVSVGTFATLLRVIRVGRIFRLVRTSRGLLLLLRTLVMSLPSLANVGTILVLLFFIFSVVGMQLFAGVRYGLEVSSDANFDSFWTAMQTLYRCSTGENYNGIMHDLMVQPPYCVPNGPGANCGNRFTPPIFWCLFYVLANFIMIKLLVAVVLDNFSEAMAADLAKAGFRVTPALLETFSEAWAKSDPKAKLHVGVAGLQRVILLLPFPLGVKGAPGVVHEQSLRKAAQRLMIEMALVADEKGLYNYHAVLHALVQRAFDLNAAARGVRLQLSDGTVRAQFSVEQHLAATVMQGAFRARKARKNLRFCRAVVDEGRGAAEYVPSSPSASAALSPSAVAATGCFGLSHRTSALSSSSAVHSVSNPANGDATGSAPAAVVPVPAANGPAESGGAPAAPAERAVLPRVIEVEGPPSGGPAPMH